MSKKKSFTNKTRGNGIMRAEKKDRALIYGLRFD